MNLSPYVANLIARWFAGQAMPAAPGTRYAALFDGNPLAAGTEVGADITGGAARIAIPTDVPALDGADSDVTSNAICDFGASASATPVDVSYLAIFDAVAAGNMLSVKILTTARVVNFGDNVRIQSGDFSLTIQKAA